MQEKEVREIGLFVEASSKEYSCAAGSDGGKSCR